MRKVVHVIRSIDQKHGGPSVCVPSLAIATSATGRYSDILVDFYGTGEDPHYRELAIAHVRLPWQPWRLFSPYTVFSELKSIMRNSDVIHAHGIWQAHIIATSKMSRQFDKPYIISAHGMLDDWALNDKRWKKVPYSILVERPNLAGAACLRALTMKEATNYRNFGVRSPIVVVPNGIDIPNRLSPEPFLNSFPELHDKRLVLFLGRIHYKKGLDLLLQAWAHVGEQCRDAHLVIAGPDCENTQAALLKEIARLGLQQSVTFTGMLNSNFKWSALAACSVFVLPSYSEGFSVAVQEAMACGRPVIVTRQCNFPEVGSEECGWLIEPDSSLLESALLECLSMSDQARARLGENGNRLVREKYSWRRIGEQMAATNDWLLGAAMPAGIEVVH